MWSEVDKIVDQNRITVYVLKTHLNPLQDLILPSPRIIPRINHTDHLSPLNSGLALSFLLLAKSPVDGCPEDSFSAASGVAIITDPGTK